MSEIKKILRMKSLGNINIVGELFKQDLITHNVILKCFALLIDAENQDEEKLEYLCELLVTTGKELEEKKVDLNSVFGYINYVLNNKTNEVSETVRNGLLEVIRLRNNNWIPPNKEIKVTNLNEEVEVKEPKQSETFLEDKTDIFESCSASQDATYLSQNCVFNTPHCSTYTFEIRHLKEIIEHKNEIIAELREHIKLLKERISDDSKLKAQDDKCV